jgi:hypothetical protein
MRIGVGRQTLVLCCFTAGASRAAVRASRQRACLCQAQRLPPARRRLQRRAAPWRRQRPLGLAARASRLVRPTWRALTRAGSPLGACVHADRLQLQAGSGRTSGSGGHTANRRLQRGHNRHARQHCMRCRQEGRARCAGPRVRSLHAGSAQLSVAALLCSSARSAHRGDAGPCTRTRACCCAHARTTGALRVPHTRHAEQLSHTATLLRRRTGWRYFGLALVGAFAPVRLQSGHDALTTAHVG